MSLGHLVGDSYFPLKCSFWSCTKTDVLHRKIISVNGANWIRLKGCQSLALPHRCCPLPVRLKEHLLERRFPIRGAIRKGCGNILDFFLFWELFFVLWFQWEVETFQVVVKRKTCYVIRLRFVEFWGACVHNCLHKSFGPLGSYLFWGLRFFVLHKTVGVLRSRALGPFSDETKSLERK